MIFTVQQLKSYISLDESDSIIEMHINATESFICKYTNNGFTDKNGNKNYPPDVISGAVKLIEWDIKYKGEPVVKSETVSRYSVSFSDYRTDISQYGYPEYLIAFLKPYVRCRF